MENPEVIIIGGSYAGLSAALSLGRSLRKVLVIDGGKPCNAVTPHSHNFLTQDGKTPADISAVAKKDVEKYPTVQYLRDLALSATAGDNYFTVETLAGKQYHTRKIILAHGITDLLPPIEGFEACWGKSVLHCPYCHGFEVKNQPTMLIADAGTAEHMVPLLYNLTPQLTLVTPTLSDFSALQLQRYAQKGITVTDTPITSVEQQAGQVQKVILQDGRVIAVAAIYYRAPFQQSSDIYQQLGVQTNEQGLIQVDPLQQTNIPGIFACGDNSNRARSVALAVSSGSMAGAAVNSQLAQNFFGQ